MLGTVPFRFTADLDQPGHEQPARLNSKLNCEMFIFLPVNYLLNVVSRVFQVCLKTMFTCLHVNHNKLVVTVIVHTGHEQIPSYHDSK